MFSNSQLFSLRPAEGITIQNTPEIQPWSQVFPIHVMETRRENDLFSIVLNHDPLGSGNVVNGYSNWQATG